MTYEEATNIIYPTTQIPENLDLTKLKINFVVNTISDNILDNAHIFRMMWGENFTNRYTSEEIEKEVFNIFDFFEEAENIENFLEVYKFNRALNLAFTEGHLGDCTAFPASCIRCMYREKLGLPYDGPESKKIGWQAINIKKE